MAGVEERAECFFVGQPSGRVLALDLAVKARHSAERIVATHQRFDQGGVAFTGADTPAQERADSREAVALRVVREVALPGPGEDVGFGQQARVVASGTLEEVGEFCDVLNA